MTFPQSQPEEPSSPKANMTVARSLMHPGSLKPKLQQPSTLKSAPYALLSCRGRNFAQGRSRLVFCTQVPVDSGRQREKNRRPVLLHGCWWPFLWFRLGGLRFDKLAHLKAFDRSLVVAPGARRACTLALFGAALASKTYAYASGFRSHSELAQVFESCSRQVAAC